jgi:predicted phosphoribosyltransferase
VRFANRREAAEQLAAKLEHMRVYDPIVLGLPRGGVPIAAVVARHLHASLDVIIVRKVGVPFHRELAMGAIGEEGAQVLEPEVIAAARVKPEEIDRIVAEEQREVVRRAERYRQGREPLSIAGRTVVIVDDGIATGSTARAAIQVARARGAARVVLACPVASIESAAELRAEVDEIVVVAAPRHFMAVGQFYEDFSATSDEEVTAALRSGASD